MGKRIFILGTFSAKNATSGGTKRVEAIINKYRELGCQVMYVPVYAPNGRLAKGKDDIVVLNGALMTKIINGNNNLVGDIITGELSATSDKIYDKIVAKFKNFKPDIVEDEQGYMLPVIERMIKEKIITNQKIIYSSHNVEFEMKKIVLSHRDFFSTKEKREIIEKIKSNERRLCEISDAVLVVSKQDGAVFSKMGAKKIILAPNGVSKSIRSDGADKKIADIYGKDNIKKSIVFVGSGHLPNFEGYEKLIGSKLGFLRADEKMVVAGPVSYLIDQYKQRVSVTERTLLNMRLKLFYHPSNEELGAILARADVIILPIVSGSGSNLKTAEAIISGKKVIATENSFIGYDEYRILPGITIVKDQTDFQKKLTEILHSDKPVKRNKKENELASNVLLQNQLKSLVEVVK